MTVRLEARDLGVRRGGRTVLAGVSLMFDRPELVALIGANGSGKSTLLATLAGLLRPSAGAVRLDGTALADLSARDLARRRAYLPQSARCEWPIAVERVVALGLTPVLPALGGPSPEDRARIDAALERFDLTPFRDRAVTTLSGGELARAMLARATVGRPEILIADEPTAGLDPRHALDAMERLRDEARAGRLVITALHDLALAARYADRVVALDQGRLAADGPTAEALTPDLLRRLFAVHARVEPGAEGLDVRLLGAA